MSFDLKLRKTNLKQRKKRVVWKIAKYTLIPLIIATGIIALTPKKLDGSRIKDFHRTPLVDKVNK